jgi:hypothetical protein
VCECVYDRKREATGMGSAPCPYLKPICLGQIEEESLFSVFSHQRAAGLPMVSVSPFLQ